MARHRSSSPDKKSSPGRKSPAIFCKTTCRPPSWTSWTWQAWNCVKTPSFYSEAEIWGAVVSQVALLLLRHIFSPAMAGQLPQILALLPQLADKKTALEYLEIILRSVSQAADAVGEDELRQALTAAFPEDGGALIATIAEKWFEQGLEQGLEQGFVRSIIRVLARRFRDVTAADIQTRLERVPVTVLEMLLDEALVTADLDTFVQKLTVTLPDDTTYSNGENE